MENETRLYLIPTPIGNLGDMTYRAVETLQRVDKILAEDTRTSGVLLKHYSITTPTESFHAFNEHKRTEQIIQRMKNGETLALITDAGTPGISDPGFLLARACADAGVKVECLPGATAFVPALVKSGMPSDRFSFEGFLPHKKGRKTKLEELSTETRTMVFYESPHRLLKTLGQFAEHMGADRKVSVSRELTKKFEETVTGSVEEVLKHFETGTVKGEFVVILEGKSK
ncbi:16S rRNA (cytidine(1402)-2'-O)-methyltransferase [Marinoscillum furvescens]|uniref:Ribosomal RNA small subunit methyltransferase I n=1 Tax=Marinoscillum furvescens DSM 4134 TaxID=1122208 RepID=A0A3D9L5H5_MARFU|nr:16S rRNA (cytidine(1402)-2'-O)-methyltransferase [Marinoscillum furvescens]RED98853.1 16S rRNA (cytidine1402-2'-O)-methyltransferase [Marinoscillum furvescens DSM 4134]